MCFSKIVKCVVVATYCLKLNTPIGLTLDLRYSTAKLQEQLLTC